MIRSWIVVLICLGLFGLAFAQEEKPIEPVVVTAARIPQPLSLVSHSVTVITEEEIVKSQAKTVADVLRAVPGVDVQRSGSPGKLTTVRLRGAESDQTLVLVDGVRLNNPFDQLANFADITADNIERIEILRGGASALYGSEAVGGVINIITKKGEGRPAPSLTLEGGSQKTHRESFSLSGSSKLAYPINYSLVLSRFDTQGQLSRDKYQGTSLSSRLGADFGRGGALDFVFRFSDSRQEIPFDFIFDPFTVLPGFPFGITRQTEDRNFSQKDSSFVGTAIYKLKPYPWWSLRFQGSGQTITRDSDNKFDPILAPNFLKSRLNGSKPGGEIQNDFTPFDFLTLTLGFDYREDRASFSSLDNFGTNFGFGLALPTSSSLDAKIIDRGVYFQSHFEFLERLFLTLGLRYDNFSTFGDTTNFKVAASYLIKKSSTKLKFNWGTQFNAPTVVDLFFPVFGNPALSPERSRSLEGGFEQDFLKGRVKFEAVYFIIRLRDRIEFVPDLLAVAPPFGALRNVGRGRSQGVEFVSKLTPWDFLTLAVNWSYLDTKNLETGKEFARRPRNKVNFQVLYDPVERVHLGAYYTLVSSQRETFKFIEASGRARLSDRNEGYSRVDLAISYDPILEKDKSPYIKGLTLFGKLDNVLDVSYSEVRGFPALGRAVLAGIKARF